MTDMKPPVVGRYRDVQEQELNPQNPAARKQWDKSEWEAKAKAKDEEYAQKAKSAEDAMAQGVSLFTYVLGYAGMTDD